MADDEPTPDERYQSRYGDSPPASVDEYDELVRMRDELRAGLAAVQVRGEDLTGPMPVNLIDVVSRRRPPAVPGIGKEEKTT